MKKYIVEVHEDYTIWKNEQGQFHREDGPAFEWADGNRTWYLNNQHLTEKEFNERMNKTKGLISKIKEKFFMGKKNPVAKNSEKFNRPKTYVDRKKEMKRGKYMDDENYHLSRIGKFYLSNIVLVNKNQEVLDKIADFIENECYILSTHEVPYEDKVEYLATSDHFREVSDKEQIPVYNIVIDSTLNTHIKFEEID